MNRIGVIALLFFMFLYGCEEIDNRSLAECKIQERPYRYSRLLDSESRQIVITLTDEEFEKFKEDGSISMRIIAAGTVIPVCVLDSTGHTDIVKGVCYGNGLWVTAGGQTSAYKSIYTSPDLLNWTSRYTGKALNSVCHSNSRFVAVGGAGAIIYSDDGISWNNASIGSTYMLYSVMYSERVSLFIAVGMSTSDGKGVILTSSNGTTWAYTATGLTYVCYGVGENNSVICVAAASGRAYYSTTGLSYTVVDTGSGQALNSVGRGLDNKLTLTGTNGSVVVSNDNALNWSSESSGTSNLLSGIAVYGTVRVMCSYSGGIYVSYDNATWSSISSGTTTNLFDIASGPGYVCAVGDDGLILFIYTGK